MHDKHEGRRELILSTGRRVKIHYRFLRGKGFWLHAKGQPESFNQSFEVALLKLARKLEHVDAAP